MMKKEKPIKKRLSIGSRAKRSKCTLNSPFGSGLCLPILCHCYVAVLSPLLFPGIIPPSLLSDVSRHHSLPTFFLPIFGSSPPPLPDFEHQNSSVPLQLWNMDIYPVAPSSWHPVSTQPHPRLGPGKPLAAEKTLYV